MSKSHWDRMYTAKVTSSNGKPHYLQFWEASHSRLSPWLVIAMALVAAGAILLGRAFS